MRRSHKPCRRTNIRLDIMRELRLRDFSWKEITARLNYANEQAVHRLQRSAGVKIR